MRGRHPQTLIALVLAGFWGFGVYFAHSHGHLRFLDRVESTMTDLRTLVRGVKVPPDRVTIVAIDDAMVKQGGSGRSGALAVWLWRSDLAAQGGEGLSTW